MYSNESAIPCEDLQQYLPDVLGCGLSVDTGAVVAVDTEYAGLHTLTVQAAARISPDTLAVQVYRSGAVPDLPEDFDVEKYLPPEKYSQFFKWVVVRRVKPLTPDLSPAAMVCDLFNLDSVNILTRAEGRVLIEKLGRPGEPALVSRPDNVQWRARPGRWKIPSLTMTLLGHFLRADLGRLFGREFLAGLLADGIGLTCTGKQLQFAEDGNVRRKPVLEYVRGDGLHEVLVTTRDTRLIAGSGSLESLSTTFLGKSLSKSDAVTESDKRDMLRTFSERPADAYGYAIVDAVTTLLVYERLAETDREIYRRFEFAEEDTPPLHGTLGRRVSTFLMRSAKRHLGESASLDSDRAIEGLMRGGGLALLRDHPDASRYGEQTGRVQGGLLFSRSPTRFWHESPGMLRDIDMSGCYPAVASKINVYFGRPVILEPGSQPLDLKEAVDLVRRVAPQDGWMIRVSGDIRDFPNALVPSTDDAMTSSTYRDRMRYGKRTASRRRAFHLETLQDPASVKGTIGSRLYSSRVESGVVTWATWLVIQALPAGVREQYERLNADTLVFYPAKLIAADGREFEDLVERYRHDGLPWEDSLDLDSMELHRREKIDSQFVSLRVPLGEYVRQITSFRREAQKRDGKGSGADRTWKDYGNTVYGVLASSYHPCNNFVAANIITAAARASAFVMSMALNSIQTITDGCTWRADQVPACNFEECLRRSRDYPVRRTEGTDGIPFQDPSSIPTDDEEFTQWYRDHVQRFLGVASPDYDELFTTHDLAHKKTATGKVLFDALACDGAGTYAKCVLGAGGEWQVTDFAARSFKGHSKSVIQQWLVATYSSDRLSEPAPLAADSQLLSFDTATREAKKALAEGLDQVVFPLGFDQPQVKNYRAIKASAFVFRTPEQRASILKQLQKFEARTGCGLEVLALRRTYGGRRQGSLVDLAEAIYDLIRESGTNLVPALNLWKKSPGLQELICGRLSDLDNQKRSFERQLRAAIDVSGLDPTTLATALVLGPEHVGLGRSREPAASLAG